MQNTSEGAENRLYVHRYSPLQEGNPRLGIQWGYCCGVLVLLTRGLKGKGKLYGDRWCGLKLKSCNGTRGIRWQSPWEGPSASSGIQNFDRFKTFLSVQGNEIPNGLISKEARLAPNLERKLQALDPRSYLNQQKRAVEEAREFRQIYNIDSSSSSSDQNGDEKSLRSPEEEEKHYGSAQDRFHSMSFDDLRSLLVHNPTTTTTNPVDSVNITRSRENASTDVDSARRMRDNKRDSSDQKPSRGRPPGTSIPRQQQPMGEIVEVEGGHIVRSIGRKDRHSKVYTAKGPRDRRVRLSAPTAIQFYDVQDRLGFDRPSKAVDWLIKKAKTSIDELTQLPPCSTLNIPNQEPKAQDEGIKEQAEQEIALENEAAAKSGERAIDSRAIARERARERAKERTQDRSDSVAKAQNYLRPRLLSLNPASTSSTVPNFLLKNAATSENLATGSNPANPQMGMRSINNISSTPLDSISRTFNLENLQQQPFYQYLFSHTNSQALQNYTTVSQFDAAAATAAAYAAAPANSEAARNSNQQTNQSLFSSSSASAFQVPSGLTREIVMPEQLHHEFFSSQPPPHRILNAPPVWNCNSVYTDLGNNTTTNMMRGGGGNYNSFTFRGTLQSSSSPVRVRSNLPFLHDNAAADQCPQTGAGFSGFRIPARIQGIDENDDVKPSPASSNSHF